MNTTQHKTIYRSDYCPPDYLVKEIYLEFYLDPSETQVIATSEIIKNPAITNHEKSLELDGEELTLKNVQINGTHLDKNGYELKEGKLIIYDVPPRFTLRVITVISPKTNHALSGLYSSNGNYCTQCEAEGFRRITYYLDRPDVLARFTTKIVGDVEKTPVLLSNGNLLEKGDDVTGKHYAVWHDPFPKPSYLFALVAGDLYCLEDTFRTQGNRDVLLQIYVEHRNKDKCDHAMYSLKKSMKWDEDTFGLEYDLDRYMIVAVDDFNMGAMENKGLNIFNSKYVLALPDSATDQDYLGIEGVIGHEYFHNWSGNRVTCRDWFQLSLKEGLTVFRDQEFSADMNSRPVKRISDVNILRTHQFKEDDGPMAHPVRPDSYVEINNFYTVTIYNKGAEVIRMLQKIIGWHNFKKGMDLYFDKFDGMAVTCDDFVDVMQEVSGIALDQFRLWYSQSGTPEIRVSEQWREHDGELLVSFEQQCKATPGQGDKKPFHIPIEIALINQPDKENVSSSNCREMISVFHLKKEKETLCFSNLINKPYVSVLRDFSAPVKIKRDLSREDLAFFMCHDSDPFNRWDAANRFSTEIILENIDKIEMGEEVVLDELYLSGFRSFLTDISDAALVAKSLILPSESYVAQHMKTIKPNALAISRQSVKMVIASTLHRELRDVYDQFNIDKKYSLGPRDMAARSLKNCCLSYLVAPGFADEASFAIGLEQFKKKNNMTDVIAALTVLCHSDYSEMDRLLDDFYNEWKENPLVVDKWLMIQATSPSESVLTRVKELMEHPAFSLVNPNKVRSLIGAYSSANHFRFHDESGEGYRFLTSIILGLDKKNPQIAARLVSPMVSFRKYEKKLASLMEEQLRYIGLQKEISADLYEIIKKTLA